MPIQIVLIITAILVAYWNSFSGQFLLDDFVRIVDNQNAKLLSSLSQAISFYPARPVASLTFGLNAAMGGLNVWGYHLVNLIIHCVSALALYGIAKRALKLFFKMNMAWVGTVIAILWAVHPIQTGAVSYIIQRYESMMGMFVLLSLYCFARGMEIEKAARWLALSIAFGILAVGCKQAGFVLPLVVLMYDRAFVSPDFSDIWKTRKTFYFLFLSVWVVAALLTFGVPAADWVALGPRLREYTVWSYAMQQPAVLLHYIKVSLWPTGLCFDCPWSPVPPLRLAASWGIFLSLITTTLFMWRRNPMIAFPFIWFFLMLAPTSSVFPIRDAMMEYRLYLSSIAIVTVFVVSLFWIFQRMHYRFLFFITTPLIGVILIALTIQRNNLYANEIEMWKDVIQKSPRSIRARSSLCVAYGRLGNFTESLPACRAALSMNPNDSELWNNLGTTFDKLGNIKETLTAFRKAVELDPSNPVMNYNLAWALEESGDKETAIKEYQKTLQINPGFLPAKQRLSVLLGH